MATSQTSGLDPDRGTEPGDATVEKALDDTTVEKALDDATVEKALDDAIKGEVKTALDAFKERFTAAVAAGTK